MNISGHIIRFRKDRIILLHSLGFFERMAIKFKHPDYKFHRTWIGNRRSLIKYLDP